jgi:KDO2-lipid IV(A) lauroyltransferase
MSEEQERDAISKRDKSKPPLRAAAEVRLMNLFGAAMERSSWDGCRRTGAWLGLLFFVGLKRRRRIAIANVRLAFPRLNEAAARQIARRASQNFGMTGCEFLHLRIATAEEIRAYADIDHLEYIQDGLALGKGVLLLTAHLGNWELMGARAAQQIPLTVIARPRSNPGVQDYIEEARATAGLEVISKFDTARASLNALRANRAVGVLPDQYAGAGGLLLPFFGHPTRFIPAVAKLGLFTGAPIVPAFGVRRTPWLADGRIFARVFPPLEMPEFARRDAESREAATTEGTRRVMRQIEQIVERYPDQWLWLHRRWRPEDGVAQALPRR